MIDLPENRICDVYDVTPMFRYRDYSMGCETCMYNLFSHCCFGDHEEGSGHVRGMIEAANSLYMRLIE